VRYLPKLGFFCPGAKVGPEVTVFVVGLAAVGAAIELGELN